jgi:hypothetical protein
MWGTCPFFPTLTEYALRLTRFLHRAEDAKPRGAVAVSKQNHFAAVVLALREAAGALPAQECGSAPTPIQRAFAPGSMSSACTRKRAVPRFDASITIVGDIIGMLCGASPDWV